MEGVITVDNEDTLLYRIEYQRNESPNKSELTGQQWSFQLSPDF